MPRLEPLPPSEYGLFARIAAWMARRRLGKVPGPMRVLAHHPQILGAVGGFELGLERAHRVEPALLSLAVLRTATLVGCSF